MMDWGASKVDAEKTTLVHFLLIAHRKAQVEDIPTPKEETQRPTASKVMPILHPIPSRRVQDPNTYFSP
jgi:hypothetical protein